MHKIVLVEIAPRAAAVVGALSVDQRLELLDRLVDAGLGVIEAGGFGGSLDGPKLFEPLEAEGRAREGVAYLGHVADEAGFAAAVAAGAAEISVTVSASEAASQRDEGRAIAEALRAREPIIEAARNRFIQVRGVVSAALGGPDDAVAPEAAAAVAEGLARMGCHEVALADDQTHATPAEVLALSAAAKARLPLEMLALRPRNADRAVLAATLEEGIETVDTALAGLGGAATEDVVDALQGLGRETGADLDRLVDAALWISDLLGRPPASMVAQTRIAKRS